MKSFLRLLTAIIVLVFVNSCNSTGQTSGTPEGVENTGIEISGTIEQQGMTSYQYGTHILTSTDSFYALKSENLDLDKYVGKNLTIVAEKIKGYPVDGGPEYLEVLQVKEE